jgi:wyosine [tRNA(Phe)-imidazoG37] synthetase (radical SAM superfamily)
MGLIDEQRGIKVLRKVREDLKNAKLLKRLKGTAADVLRGILNRHRNLTWPGVKNVADAVWELKAKPGSLGNDEAKAVERIFRDICDVLGKQSDAEPWTFEQFHKALQVACGTDNPLDDRGDALAGRRILAGDTFFRFFWSPLFANDSERPTGATIFIWDENHHFDMLPTLEVVRMLGFQTECRPFDLRGNCMSPGARKYHYSDYSAFCVIGRPSLYKSCDVLYDQDPREERLPKERALVLPDVDSTTKDFMKNEITNTSRRLFHRVLVGTGSSRIAFEVEDKMGKSQMTRTDYAVIQRFKLKHAGTVVILAGCTALGTVAAADQAVKHQFNRIPKLREPSPEDSIEILLKVTGSVPLGDEGEKWPWEVHNCEPLAIYVNFKAQYIDDRLFAEARKRNLREDFKDYLNLLKGRYRYTQNKYSLLLSEKWPEVRRLAEGEALLVKPSYFEIHPCEPCQLNCVFCRGALREVPSIQGKLDIAHLERLIQEIHQLNNKAFIRFSGTIGEPLLLENIHGIFALIRSLKELRYGVTTNGLRLDKDGLLAELIFADYVHVSLDAGSDRTYRTLKRGHRGDFDHVLQNIAALHKAKKEEEKKQDKKTLVDLVVSLVIQEENYAEIDNLSGRLREIGVGAFELKMQHYDRRRRMTQDSLLKAYELISRVQARDQTPDYRIVVVQPAEAALAKLHQRTPSVDFSQCFANRLGLNATIDAKGQMQSCCQYYQGTLGVQGKITAGLAAVWSGADRQKVLSGDPRKTCVNCSPSDEMVNRFVAFLVKARQEDSSFMEWAEGYVAANSTTHDSVKAPDKK